MHWRFSKALLFAGIVLTSCAVEDPAPLFPNSCDVNRLEQCSPETGTECLATLNSYVACLRQTEPSPPPTVEIVSSSELDELEARLRLNLAEYDPVARQILNLEVEESPSAPVFRGVYDADLDRLVLDGSPDEMFLEVGALLAERDLRLNTLAETFDLDELIAQRIAITQERSLTEILLEAALNRQPAFAFGDFPQLEVLFVGDLDAIPLFSGVETALRGETAAATDPFLEAFLTGPGFGPLYADERIRGTEWLIFTDPRIDSVDLSLPDPATVEGLAEFTKASEFRLGPALAELTGYVRPRDASVARLVARDGREVVILRAWYGVGQQETRAGGERSVERDRNNLELPDLDVDVLEAVRDCEWYLLFSKGASDLPWNNYIPSSEAGCAL